MKVVCDAMNSFEIGAGMLNMRGLAKLAPRAAPARVSSAVHACQCVCISGVGSPILKLLVRARAGLWPRCFKHRSCSPNPHLLQ